MELEEVAPRSGCQDLASGRLVEDRRQQPLFVELDAEVVVLEGPGVGCDHLGDVGIGGDEVVDLITARGDDRLEEGLTRFVPLDGHGLPRRVDGRRCVCGRLHTEKFPAPVGKQIEDDDGIL